MKQPIISSSLGDGRRAGCPRTTCAIRRGGCRRPRRGSRPCRAFRRRSRARIRGRTVPAPVNSSAERGIGGVTAGWTTGAALDTAMNAMMYTLTRASGHCKVKRRCWPRPKPMAIVLCTTSGPFPALHFSNSISCSNGRPQSGLASGSSTVFGAPKFSVNLSDACLYPGP
jgi:hypothetical protein